MWLKPNDLGKCIMDSSWDILQQYLSKWMISTPVSQNQLSTMDAPHYVGRRQSVGIISAFVEFFLTQWKHKDTPKVPQLSGMLRLKDFSTMHSPVKLYIRIFGFLFLFHILTSYPIPWACLEHIS